MFGSGPDGGDNPEAPGPSTPQWGRVDGAGDPGRCEVVPPGDVPPPPPPAGDSSELKALRVRVAQLTDEVNAKNNRIAVLERDVDNERAQRIEKQAAVDRLMVEVNDEKVKLANVRCEGQKIFGYRASCRVIR